MTEAEILDRDGVRLRLRRWAPAGPPRAIVQIAHGLAEHSGRYDRFARALAAAGFAVIAHDHRGHGETAARPEDLGFFAERDGWATVLADLDAVQAVGRSLWPGVPVFLFGHSMGSFMVQDLVSRSGIDLAGAVLSGSDGSRPPPGARSLAAFERWRLGPRGQSALIHALAFGAFGRKIPGRRTEFDWLSRDPAEVDAYSADPLCGFVATVQLWVDLLGALARLGSEGHRARVPKGLPILSIAGTADPVSNGGKGIGPLVEGYRRAGLADVTDRRYEGARHELLNETNREEVTADVVAWLDARLQRLR